MGELSQATSTNRADPVGEEADGGVVIERRGQYSASCNWSIPNFSKVKQRTLWSKYFEVGGYDCRLLVYPSGDSQALPGYVSVYLQLTDPRGGSGKWDCFCSYRLSVVNQANPASSLSRDSWHRFSAKKRSHGWCDFTPAAPLLEARQGFAVNDTVLVSADILILDESVSFSREADFAAGGQGVGASSAEVLSGKFTWKVRNFGAFREMIRSQKIMSPAFPAGECALRLSVYQSAVGGADQLSLCLESKDADASKAGGTIQERTCWCLFRMSVLSQLPGGKHLHRDSYGRFAADGKAGDNTSLGWNDFMPMTDFLSAGGGYMVEETATFSASFHIIKESSSFSRSLERSLSLAKARGKGKGAGAGDAYQGKFTWRIEHFTRLKELLKKRKISGLCIKSRRFQVGSRDCRLIVYPRGQSQPPCHLSMFLEVTDPRTSAADWSCFVSHRLSVVNQRGDERSVTKESQNRYSKQAKDWGWREFVTLTSLFDLDAGFLVNDAVVFAAEVLILKETCECRMLPTDDEVGSEHTAGPLSNPDDQTQADAERVPPGFKIKFTWRVENFLAFKEIMETRKIFSKFFAAGACELRIGVYESFDTLCIYLESDLAGAGAERNFWVKYRIAVLNQRHPDRTEWKESAICTKTWNNSVLQFMKVSEMVDPEAGYLQRDGVVLACEVLECCPWFEFADLEVYASDEEADGSTEVDELQESDDELPSSPASSTASEEDLFRSLLARAGLHLGGPSAVVPIVVDASALQQVTMRENSLADAPTVAAFLAGMRIYLDDPLKVKRLLLPTVSPGRDGGAGEPQACLLALLMSIRALQHPLVDLLLDLMIQCCHSPQIRAAARRDRDMAPPRLIRRPREGLPMVGGEHGDAPMPGPPNGPLMNGMPAYFPSGRADSADCASASCSTLEPTLPAVPAHFTPPGFPASGGLGSLAPSPPLSHPSPGLQPTPSADASDAAGTPISMPIPTPMEQRDPPSVPTPSTPEPTAKTPLPGAAGRAAYEATTTPRPHHTPSDARSAAGTLAGAGSAAENGISAESSIDGGVGSHDSDAASQGLQDSSGSSDLDSEGSDDDADGSEAGDADSRYDADGEYAQSRRRAAPGNSGIAGIGLPSAASLAATPEFPGVSALSGGGGAHGGANGHSAGATAAAGGTSASQRAERMEEVLSMIISFLRSLDAGVLHGVAAAGGGKEAAQHARQPAVAKIATLLSGVPRALQPEVIMLVPKLAGAGEHTAAAGALLGRLAEASREGPEVEAELRMAVLAALGALRIDPAVAEKVLRAALEALPCLSEAELPPAVGLVLKLACERPGSREAAIRVVRERVKRSPSGVSSGTLDAMRLAVTQHLQVAQAMLADIDADCRAAKNRPGGAAQQGGDADGEAGPAPGMMHVADLEMLMDMLAKPAIASETERVFERAVARGLVPELELAAVLERRRMQHLVATSIPPPRAAPSPTPAGPGPSLQQPLGGGPAMPCLPVLGLFPGPLVSADDFSPALMLAEALASSKNARVRLFSASLYATLFRVYGDEASRERMLRGIVVRAATSAPTPQQPAAGGAAAAPPQPPHGANGLASPSGGRPRRGSATALDLSTPTGLLTGLVEQFGSCSKTALALMTQAAHNTRQQLEALQRRMKEVEEDAERAAREAGEASARVARERGSHAQQAAELEAQVARMRSERKAELAAFNAAKKDLQDKVRGLEREVEWLKAERADEVAAAEKQAREAAARAKEADAALARLKLQRRDETKKAAKDRGALADRLRDAEGAISGLQDELERVRRESDAAARVGGAALREADERAAAAGKTARAKEEEAARCQAYIDGLEAKLASQQSYAGELERSLQTELSKNHLLMGTSSTDALSSPELAALVRVHEEGLQRLRAQQAQRQREEGAAAVAAAAVSAVTGEPASQTFGAVLAGAGGGGGGTPSTPPRPPTADGTKPPGGPAAAASFPSASLASLGGIALPGYCGPQHHSTMPRTSFGSMDSLASITSATSGATGAAGVGGAAEGGAGAAGHLGGPPRSAVQSPHGFYSGTGLHNLGGTGKQPGVQQGVGAQPGQGGNFALPLNGFPNGLLGGSALLNGKAGNSNGTHTLW